MSSTDVDWWEAVDALQNEELTDQDLLNVYHLDTRFQVPFPEKEAKYIKNPFWIRYNNLSNLENADLDSAITRDDKGPWEFSSLINCGMTCYAGVILQNWFHTLQIRVPILESVSPSVVLVELQKLFVSLESSRFKQIDPSDLYKSINLEIGEQQDAQEFAMQLMQHIRDEDPDLKTIFEETMDGTFEERIKCKSCGEVSTKNDIFTVINLNPTLGLQEALEEAFMPENLDEWRCPACEAISDEEKTICITKFPDILQFQLRRYRVNQRTHSPLKIMTDFAFPDEIEMKDFFHDKNSAQEDLTYVLKSLICHHGSSLNSGHYVTRVKHNDLGWTQFNDTVITDLEIEEDGINRDKDVYVITYIKKSVDQAGMPNRPQESSRLKALKDEMESNENKLIEARQNESSNKKKLLSVIRDISNCPIEGRDPMDFHFIPVKWARSLLQDLDDTGVDNEKIKCPHGKVFPPRPFQSTIVYRVIPPEAAEIVYNEMGGGPALIVRDNMCKDCVNGLRQWPRERCQAPPADDEEMEIEEHDEDSIHSVSSSDEGESTFMISDVVESSFEVPIFIVNLTGLELREESQLIVDFNSTVKEVKALVRNSLKETADVKSLEIRKKGSLYILSEEKTLSEQGIYNRKVVLEAFLMA